MTEITPMPDLRRIGESAFTEVLNTFLSLPATVAHAAADGLPAGAPEPISSLVPLSGERLSVAVRLQLPSPFLALAVKLLTGLDGDSAEAAALQEDAAGELANMVAGRVAAQLTASGYPCRLGTPSVVRRATLPTTPEPGANYGRAGLLCAGYPLWLEIQCRYQVP